MKRLATVVFVAGILAGCGGSKAVGVTARATIPKNATLRVAADSLSSAGLIGSPTLFRIYARIRGGGRPIRAGTYVLPRNIGWSGILDALNGGKGLVRMVTIPEGFAIPQIVRTVSARLQVPAESVEVAVRDTSWLRRFDIPSGSLEGYLFPDTYTVPEGSSAAEAVSLMAKRFEQAWKPQWTARLDTLGLSRHDVMTLASIVEREARLPEERPVIAGVYLNRLRAGMRLQADPTVQYALPAHKPRLFYKDLRVKSLYNTYIHKGLPPGPIASPGEPSIVAALYPAKVPYKYFVAFPDGHHEFRATIKQHEVAVKASRKAWAAYYLLHPADTTTALAAEQVPSPAPNAIVPAAKAKRAR